MFKLKNIVTYLDKAIKSNTGVSSLSLIVVSIGIMAIITLVVICLCMLIEMLFNHTIASSLDGYASIITSIATLVGAVGIPKAINNYGENKFKQKQHTEKDED